MERYKVSGSELRAFYQGETSLGRVFMDIERELKTNNQVVCQFIVNGMELQENDEQRFSVISLNEVETLEYLSEGAEVLVESVINSWIDALPELINRNEQLSERIRTAGMVGSFKDIHDLVENCEYLVGSMASIKQMMGDVLNEETKKWDEAERSSYKTVKQAVQAMEKKDFVQLADILEYDLNHTLQTWLESLIQLGEVFDFVESGSSAAAAKVRSNLGSRGRSAH